MRSQYLTKSLHKYFSNETILGPVYKQIQSKLNNIDSLCKTFEEDQETKIKLKRQEDSVLCKYWWSESPFKKNTDLMLPLYSLQENKFVKKSIQLESLIFNVPIRRDLIHRTVLWQMNFDKQKTHSVKKTGEIRGSGKKPRPQKGTGQARLGHKRASGRRKGQKAFGPRPRLLTTLLPNKIKLKAITACCSAKLAEGKIRIFDSEKLATHKTNSLHKIFPRLGEKELYLFIVSKNIDENFDLASRKLNRVKVINPNQVNVLTLMKFDKVYFTQQSLLEFTQLMLAVLFQSSKPKAVTDEEIEGILNLNYNRDQPDKEEIKFDPEIGFEPNFQILKDYYKTYKRLQKNDGLKEYEKEKPGIK